MKYAVVRTQGHQYVVSEGDKVDVPMGEEIKLETLLVVDGSKVEVGTPTLDSKKVSFTVVEEKVLGDKIDGFKYKAKSRYRKSWGHRIKNTRISIDSIKA